MSRGRPTSEGVVDDWVAFLQEDWCLNLRHDRFQGLHDALAKMIREDEFGRDLIAQLVGEADAGRDADCRQLAKRPSASAAATCRRRRCSRGGP